MILFPHFGKPTGPRAQFSKPTGPVWLGKIREFFLQFLLKADPKTLQSLIFRSFFDRADFFFWEPDGNLNRSKSYTYNSIPSSQTGYFVSKDLTFVMYQQRVSKYVLLCHCGFCRIVDLAGAMLQQSWCAPLPSVHVKRAKHVRFYMHDLCALFRTLLGYILLVWHNCTSQRVFFSSWTKHAEWRLLWHDPTQNPVYYDNR